MELLPRDVVTLANDYAGASKWRLIERLELALEGRLQRWQAEPAMADGRFAAAMSLAFTLSQVASVVPGWRAGQRRRVQETKAHPAFEGVVSSPPSCYSTPPPCGTWVITDSSNVQRWAVETEPSELLEEAPAAREVTPAFLTKPEATAAMVKYKELLDRTTTEVMGSMRIPPESLSPPSTDGVKCAKCRAPRNVKGDGTGGTSRDPHDRAYCRDHRSLWGTARREVSGNGRDWVDYASLVDADPFEAYAHRRIDGVEPTIYYLACRHSGGGLCKKPAERRHIGGEPTELCGEHFVVNDGYDRSLTDNREEARAARIRMALMDINHGDRNVRPAGCDPTLFGGIWTTR